MASPFAVGGSSKFLGQASLPKMRVYMHIDRDVIASTVLRLSSDGFTGMLLVIFTHHLGGRVIVNRHCSKAFQEPLLQKSCQHRLICTLKIVYVGLISAGDVGSLISPRLNRVVFFKRCTWELHA